MEGVSCKREIANLFMDQFKVTPAQHSTPFQTNSQRVQNASPPVGFTASEVAHAIRNMTGGKSPGHDKLSIEHFKHAGVHLPRVLAMLYTFCVRHC